ncbi:hypothetical protein B0H14DRAFT_2560751 [Mycena olivaceomarginata]|nr:hypothetical protein B0H14DRAFT_2560751 [Mycena olivaceomarginata]
MCVYQGLPLPLLPGTPCHPLPPPLASQLCSGTKHYSPNTVAHYVRQALAKAAQITRNCHITGITALRCLTECAKALGEYDTSVVPKIEFTHKHVGGSQHSRFSVAEVVPYHTGEANAWTTENYQVLYVSHGSAEELREQFSSDADRILCDVPLRMLAPKLTKAKLQAIASIHGITTPKRRTTEEVKNMVSNHVCTSECPDSLSVFERVPDRSSEIFEHRRVRKQVLRGEKRAKIRPRDPGT